LILPQQARPYSGISYDTMPQYLIGGDHDAIFGGEVERLLKDMGIQKALTAPRSP
jgi:hypothetical protein